MWRWGKIMKKRDRERNKKEYMRGGLKLEEKIS
jgi:hypothetical protein